MVSNSTVACQYHSGTGTNQITFRGRRSSTDAGFLGFTDNFIHVNGTATMQSDSETFSGILSETDGGQADDSIVLDASSAASGTVNGALTASTTVTVDGVGGTIAVGQIVTVKGAAASITAAFDSDTGISTDNTLTITAVASQTSFTVSEPITVADDINLLFSADAGEGIEQNSISMSLEGADGATSVVGDQAYRTGFGVDTKIGRVGLLQDDDGFLVNEDGTGNRFSAEEFTTDASGLVTETQAGSASGSSEILKGVTTL
jgi:hypothetical protein